MLTKVDIEGNIFLYPPKKEPFNIIIIHIGLCVSSYYRTVVSDCRLPFVCLCLFVCVLSPFNVEVIQRRYPHLLSLANDI